jgi:hypothetical protein
MTSKLVSSLCVLSLVLPGACKSVTEPAVPAPEVPKFTCLSNSATMRLPVELRAALPPTSGGRGLEDAFLAISQSVPGGFAGMVWETNHFVLTFVEPEKANAARAEVEQALVTHRAVAPGTDLRTVEIRGGVRWTFVELEEWFRYIMSQRAFVPGVSSWGIDEGHNTIHYGVIDESARAALEAKFASIGVSCNLVTTVIQPYASLL